MRNRQLPHEREPTVRRNDAPRYAEGHSKRWFIQGAASRSVARRCNCITTISAAQGTHRLHPHCVPAASDCVLADIQSCEKQQLRRCVQATCTAHHPTQPRPRRKANGRPRELEDLKTASTSREPGCCAIPDAHNAEKENCDQLMCLRLRTVDGPASTWPHNDARIRWLARMQNEKTKQPMACNRVCSRERSVQSAVALS